jgi:hypothetical protein
MGRTVSHLDLISLLGCYLLISFHDLIDLVIVKRVREPKQRIAKQHVILRSAEIRIEYSAQNFYKLEELNCFAFRISIAVVVVDVSLYDEDALDALEA